MYHILPKKRTPMESEVFSCGTDHRVCEFHEVSLPVLVCIMKNLSHVYFMGASHGWYHTEIGHITLPSQPPGNNTRGLPHFLDKVPVWIYSRSCRFIGWSLSWYDTVLVSRGYFHCLSVFLWCCDNGTAVVDVCDNSRQVPKPKYYLSFFGQYLTICFQYMTAVNTCSFTISWDGFSQRFHKFKDLMVFLCRSHGEVYCSNPSQVCFLGRTPRCAQ